MNKTYPLFEHWYKTLDWILSCVEKFPKNARFSLASRIADLSLGAMELIIEAIYSKDRSAILTALNLNFEKLRVLFRIAHDRRYISGRQYEFISKAINESGKMTGGWKKASV
jgi:hypothetical protein